jgi:OOP family OmpA-OmpF porin
MTKKWLVATFGAAALCTSAGALAQQPANPIYVGADIGRADFGSDDDTAFKIFGGYQFHPNVGAEAAWSQLFDKSGVKVEALELVAVGFFPLQNQFSVIGKLGIANVDVKTPFGSNDKTEITWGLGVQYDVTPKIGVRGQWQRYETDDAIDLISIGVLVRF